MNKKQWLKTTNFHFNYKFTHMVSFLTFHRIALIVFAVYRTSTFVQVCKFIMFYYINVAIKTNYRTVLQSSVVMLARHVSECLYNNNIRTHAHVTAW